MTSLWERWRRRWFGEPNSGGPSSSGPSSSGPSSSGPSSSGPSSSGPSSSAPPSTPTDPAEQQLRSIRDVELDDPAKREAALRALQSAAGTPLERRALGACLMAHGRGQAPDELRCLLAELLVKRGEPSQALGVLDGVALPRAWLLEADLRAERGQLAVAQHLVERVLARDLDTPGALERLRRWAIRTPAQRQLGLTESTLLVERSLAPTLTILEEAGRGGAASVYCASDRVLGRHVALKLYHQPEQDRAQLLREARMAVRLAGAHVVRVFDASSQHGWIAMEWADQGSLKQRMTSSHEALPPLETWFWGLASALAEIHEQGFVHADVKPANVLLRSDGRVLLSDFGLTVPIGAAHLGSSAGYVSPERHAGERASPRDDVYALGQILIEALKLGQHGQSWGTVAENLVSPSRPSSGVEVLGLLPR